VLPVITKFELIFGTITNLLAHRSTLRVSRFATACPAGPPLAEAEPLARDTNIVSRPAPIRVLGTLIESLGTVGMLSAVAVLCHSGLDPESIQIVRPNFTFSDWDEAILKYGSSEYRHCEECNDEAIYIDCSSSP